MGNLSPRRGDRGRSSTQMYNANPYSSTLLTDTREPGTRVRIALWWLVYLHPAITLALIYTCWILTTVASGRPPGLGEESGSLIVCRVTYVLGATGAILTVAGPILLPLSLLWGLCQPFTERFSEGSKTKKRVLCLGIYFLKLVFVAFVCHYDPSEYLIGFGIE
ncbi:MAG: hypothetical protein SFV81_21135 [Pirellulaceae bacterium]|nr:hypothetical protein [Pirellulaceae bacterium]